MKPFNAINSNSPNTWDGSDGPVSTEPPLMKIPSLNFGLGSCLDEAHVREEARIYFFSVLREVCPELLFELKRELFPVYVKWAKEQSAGRREGGLATTPRSFLELESSAPEMASAILNWCSKSQLVGEIDTEPEYHGPDWEGVARADSLWPAMFVCEALWVWSRPSQGSHLLNSNPPEWPHKSTWCGRVGGPRKVVVPIPELEGFRTKAEYLRQATKWFERVLREDSKQQELLYGPRHQRSFKLCGDHFIWLVLRQVTGQSDRAIVEWECRNGGKHVTIDAIRIGSMNAAKVIGLRRSHQRGRPRKIEGPTHQL
jgi:hypothetical protein